MNYNIFIVEISLILNLHDLVDSMPPAQPAALGFTLLTPRELSYFDGSRFLENLGVLRF